MTEQQRVSLQNQIQRLRQLSSQASGVNRDGANALYQAMSNIERLVQSLGNEDRDVKSSFQTLSRQFSVWRTEIVDAERDVQRLKSSFDSQLNSFNSVVR